MAGKIFMSYSRRELGFVDDLVSKLDEKKYAVWLFYKPFQYSTLVSSKTMKNSP